MANLRVVVLNRLESSWWPVLVHSVRTAVAAVASLLVARLFRLPQPFWATITTLVITQSSLGAAFTVSWQRFVGTALGAALGAIMATQFGGHVLVFGVGVCILGLLSAVTRSDISAYRFGGITLAIVLLLQRTGSGRWQIAFDRFAEVSVGIGVALIFAWGVAGERTRTVEENFLTADERFENP